jgi:oligoendopeptidase F
MTEVQDVVWDLEPLVDGAGESGALRCLEQAMARADDLQRYKGRVATLAAGALAELMEAVGDIREMVARGSCYAELRYAADTTDPSRGALLQKILEESTAVTTRLLFVTLEWASANDEHVEQVLADERLAFCAHHLRTARRYRRHLLSEPEERIDAEKAVSGREAWVRLFTEQTSAIVCELPGEDLEPPAALSLDGALALLTSPERAVRRRAAAAVTAALAPGLRTRAYIYNTVVADRAIDDRLRSYPSWVASRNLSNETSDASVTALVAAVRARYDLPHRWYRLKAQLLGLPFLADYDRYAPLTSYEPGIGWDDGWATVLDAYTSFSPELAGVIRAFGQGGWIDAPARPGKAPGAFCEYTVPSHHPYVLLNWAGKPRDVLTLAHELGHGVHGYLSRPQGVFHLTTPLTLAETASVFGETITLHRLLEQADDASTRLALLTDQVDGVMATVFRQVAMHCFEEQVHTLRREQGELALQELDECWTTTQAELLGDAVEITTGYRTWWSYIPHFVATPGYVYAYAYGQLLALALYRQYEAQGAAFVPQYLELLRAGGSRSPEELGAIVGCDLADPDFWNGGLATVEALLAATEEAAAATGALTT